MPEELTPRLQDKEERAAKFAPRKASRHSEVNSLEPDEIPGRSFSDDLQL